MTEFELIYHYFEQQTAVDAGALNDVYRVAPVIKDLGDDAAVINIQSDTQWVTCVDTLVQGRHFSGDWSQVDDLAFAIGFKAVAVNVSDVVAMGATPHSILLALAMPERLANETWLSQFSKGLFHACSQFGIRLIGGDTTRNDSLVISITANGIIPAGQHPIYRNGASVGDKIYVTGTLGDASYALKHAPDTDKLSAIKANEAVDLTLEQSIASQLAHRLHMPTPRIKFAQALAKPSAHSYGKGLASAMMDISDGLVQDLGHICQQSGVTARLNLEALPLSKPLQDADLSERLLCQLTGGDDYELLFTVDKDIDEAIIQALAKANHTRVTCIGEVINKLTSNSTINSHVKPKLSDKQPAIALYYKSKLVTKKTPFPFASYPSLAGFQHFSSPDEA